MSGKNHRIQTVTKPVCIRGNIAEVGAVFHCRYPEFHPDQDSATVQKNFSDEKNSGTSPLF